MTRLLAVLTAFLLLPAAFAAAQTTNPTPPTATSGSASSITQTGATVSATIDPQGADTTWQIQYGTTTGYGLTSSSETLGATSSSTTVTKALTGLTAGTTYHFRVVATNAAGTTNGADKSFTTTAAPAAPGVETRPATSIRADGASLNAAVDPNGQATSYAFEYGPTTGLGLVSPSASAGSGTTARTVTTAVGGLQPNTRYYFRVVATSAGGVRRGSTASFTTTKVPISAILGQPLLPLTFGKTLALQGQLSGTGVANQSVQLQSNPYPFTGGFKNAGAAKRSDAAGIVRFTIATFSRATQFRIRSGSATSGVITVSVKPVVTLKRRYLRRGRVRLSGFVQPGSANGSVSLQRKTPAGRWMLLKRAALKVGTSYSRFTTITKRRSMTVRAVYKVTNGPLLRADSNTRSVSAR